MHLLARADAGPELGAGHVVRMLALAEAAGERGWQTTLCGDVSVPWIEEAANAQGVERGPGFDDAAGLTEAVTSLQADAVVVDHYGLPPDLRSAAHSAGAVLVSVEDLGFGRRPADVVIDYHVGSDQEAHPDDGSAVVLRGPAYVPVRRAVVAARQQRAAARVADHDPLLTLVVLGGTDAAGVTPLACDVLAGIDRRLDVIVVGDHRCEVGRVAVRSVPAGQPLPGLLADADVVLSAAGVSAYEACCIGTPAALVAVAANQQGAYERLVRYGLALGLGSTHDLRDRPDAAADLLLGWLDDTGRRAAMARRASASVDGDGADRILDAISLVAG